MNTKRASARQSKSRARVFYDCEEEKEQQSEVAPSIDDVPLPNYSFEEDNLILPGGEPWKHHDSSSESDVDSLAEKLSQLNRPVSPFVLSEDEDLEVEGDDDELQSSTEREPSSPPPSENAETGAFTADDTCTEGYNWAITMDVLVANSKANDHVLNTYIASVPGSAPTHMHVKKVVMEFHNVAGGTTVQERGLFEKLIPCHMVNLQVGFELHGQTYSATIQAPITAITHFVEGLLYEVIRFDLAPFRSDLPSVCSSRWDFALTPAYRKQYNELKAVAQASAASGEDAVAVLFGLFQDATALGGIGGESINPVLAFCLLFDTFFRSKTDLNEILASIVPDSHLGNYYRNGEKIPYKSVSKEAATIFNREFVIDAVRKVVEASQGRVGRVSIGGHRICFAVGVHVVVVDSPAKAALTGTVLGQCPVCEQGRGLPATTVSRDQDQVNAMRAAIASSATSPAEKGKMTADLREGWGLHPSEGICSTTDKKDQSRFTSQESMHVRVNVLGHFLQRLECASSNTRIQRASKGDEPSLEPRLDTAEGRVFYASVDGKTTVKPLNSRGDEELTSRQRTQVTEKSARWKALKLRAETIGGAWTTALIYRKGKMWPRLLGFDALIVAMLSRDPETGLFMYFEDQVLALLCIQVALLYRVLTTLASDFSAGFALTKLTKVAELLRIKWLHLSCMLGFAHEPSAVHSLIAHTVQSVSLHGNMGIVDSPTKESGHKTTKLGARYKQNHQKRDRKNKSELGEHSNIQVQRALLRRLIALRWFARRFDPNAKVRLGLRVVYQNGGVFGAPRRYEAMFTIKGSWELAKSMTKAKVLFPGVAFEISDDVSLATARGVCSKLSGVLVDANRTVTTQLRTKKFKHCLEELLPKESSFALGSRENESRVLSWTTHAAPPPEGSCKNEDCFGCWQGWLSSGHQSSSEQYGLPLGFYATAAGEKFAVVIILEIDVGIEPAFKKFAVKGTVPEDFCCDYGGYVFDANPVVQAVPVKYLRGTAQFFTNVTCGGGHFLVYRRNDNILH